ncbi:MAG: thioredoxin family protein [Clostridium sp.]|nr:thioredoxin family protein [Clostridium sp.]
MIIKILGTGCRNCKNLEANAREAVKELGLDAVVEKVEDIKDIMAYGVMRTPALVIDEKVKVMGRVPKTEEIKEILKG